jgi:transposase
MCKKRQYPSTELSADQRELVARLVGPLEVRGISRSVFRDVLAEAGITVPKSSLDRWVRAHSATGRVFTAEKASGRVALLDDEQCEIAAGWVLSENDLNQVVSLASFSKFCASAFGVELAQTTAHDYLHALGFSSKVSQVKTSGFTIDADALAKTMFEWKSERQRAGELTGLLASVDFTFTGHRTDRRVTYAPAGGAQPKSSTAIARFTNCIVTVVWSDGVNRTPPILFTFNGKFRLDRVGRKAWVQERDKLVSALARFGIDAKRVIHIGAEKNETRLYASESADLLHRFFALYRIPLNVVVFSDNGKSFFPGGVSVLESLGFAKHVSYPAPVHQYLSPNDNRLHGTAKARWRNSGVDFKDDVESSLLLLNHLDVDLAAHGATWFKQNILDLTAKSARELIRGRSGNKAQADYDRLYAYHIFAGLEAIERPEEASALVPSNLHGRMCSG